MAVSDDSISEDANIEPDSPIMIFLSMPASLEYCFSPSQSQPETPRDFEDANSSFDDFEFETSRCLNLNDIGIEFEERIKIEKQQEKHDKKQEIPFPEMAFADELFRDGKVLPLLPSLKPPPRLQPRNTDDGSKKVAISATLRSPISAIRSKISPSNSFDSRLDPSMEALKNVGEDEDEGKPLESTLNISLGLKAHYNPPPNGPRSIRPKGPAILRKVRLVKIGFKINVGPHEEPVEDKNVKTKETKGQKWNFSSSRIRKLTSSRRCKVKLGEISDDKKVTKMTRKTVVPYRPKLSLCWGSRPKSYE